MFLLLSFHSFSADICPCEVHQSRNPGCCCSGIENRADYPAGCYPDFPDSILPSCPSTHFDSTLPLADWLLQELFCVAFDHRDVANGRTAYVYSTANTTTYIPTYPNATSEAKESQSYLPKSYIYDTDGKILLLPTASSTSVCTQNLPFDFLYNIDNQDCYSTSGITLATFQNWSVAEYPGSLNNVTLVFNGVNQTNVTDWTIKIKNLLISVEYEPSGNHSITAMYFNYTTYDSTATAPYKFTLNVQYVESGSSITLSSGQIGYASNSKVIVGTYTVSGNNTNITLFDDLSKNILPLPIGSTCDGASYSPLKFGVDSLGGCNSNYNTTTNPLKKNLAIAKIGEPNPENLQDWFLLDLPITCGDNSYYKYVFYTEKNGTVNMPINVINKVELTCEPLPNSLKGAMVSATFVETPQSEVKHIGKFPLKLVRLPVDFFYPFSKQTTTSSSSSSSS